MAVTDAVFHRIMVTNNLSSLKDVRIYSCAVTMETPKMLMLSAPEKSARKVHCNSCRQVTSGELHALNCGGKETEWRVGSPDYDSSDYDSSDDDDI